MELTRKLLCWLAFTVLEHAMVAELTFIRSYCHACFLSHDIVFLALITVIVFCSIFNVGELLNWDVYKATILLPVTVRLYSKSTDHTALLSLLSNCSFSTICEKVFGLFKRGVGLCMGTWRRRDLAFFFFLYGNLIYKGYLLFVFVSNLVFEYFLYNTLCYYGWVK